MGKSRENQTIDPVRVRSIVEMLEIDETIAALLHARGYSTPIAVYEYLHPRFGSLPSPFIMHGMYDAVDRIRTAVAAGELIGIFADSDLDGITSLAMLYNLLQRMNNSPIVRYPCDDEQYGLTMNMIDEFHQKGVKLLITVDSGTRDVKEIAHARELGISVIITDHHEADASLPDAIIVNPKIEQCQYPFKSLAGVGVAFKLCHAVLFSYLPGFNKLFILLDEINGSYHAAFIRNGINEGLRVFESNDSLISFVRKSADGASIVIFDQTIFQRITSGSVIPSSIYFIDQFVKKIPAVHSETGGFSLDDACVHFSIYKDAYSKKIDLYTALFLEVQFRSSPRIMDFIEYAAGLVSIGSVADIMPLINENRVLVKKGMKALSQTDHKGLSILIGQDTINTRKIGWDIAPLLNTPGRFGRTELTVDFFLSNDTAKAQELIVEIKKLNDMRKSLINDAFITVLSEIRGDEKLSAKDILIVETAAIPDGLAGLLASRISEETRKPVIVIIRPGKNGCLKGSGRCIEKLNFFSMVDPHSILFEKLGGHAQAFGFTIHEQNLPLLVEKLGNPIIPEEIINTRNGIDLELTRDKISIGLADKLEALEPFGPGNEEPIFITRCLTIDTFSFFGVKSNHGKLSFHGLPGVSAIGWNMGNKLKDVFDLNRPMDLVYRLEMNIFNGLRSLRMVIVDINPASV